MLLSQVGSIAGLIELSPLHNQRVWCKPIESISAVELMTAYKRICLDQGEKVADICFSVLHAELSRYTLLGAVDAEHLIKHKLTESTRPLTLQSVTNLLMRFCLSDRQAIVLSLLLDAPLREVISLTRHDAKRRAAKMPVASQIIDAVVPFFNSDYLFWKCSKDLNKVVPRYGIESRFCSVTQIEWSVFQDKARFIISEGNIPPFLLQKC